MNAGSGLVEWIIEENYVEREVYIVSSAVNRHETILELQRGNNLLLKTGVRPKPTSFTVIDCVGKGRIVKRNDVEDRKVGKLICTLSL